MIIWGIPDSLKEYFDTRSEEDASGSHSLLPVMFRDMISSFVHSSYGNSYSGGDPSKNRQLHSISDVDCQTSLPILLTIHWNMHIFDENPLAHMA